MTDKVTGYLSGELCEERLQWEFEGQWEDEDMQPLLAILHNYIRFVRSKYHFDVTNYWTFTYDDIYGKRWYHVTRRQWRYSLDAWSLGELAAKLKGSLNV